MSGNNALGDTTFPGDCQITVEANATVSAGDVLAIDQGATQDQKKPIVAPAASGTADIDQAAGVATEDIASGGEGSMLVTGSVIAAVDTGVSAGASLTASTTAGQYADGSDGPAVALSDEGGTDSTGTSLGSNEAEVFVR
jgi:hypothetical protein